MSEPDADPCEILDWDSQFFGMRIARVRGDTLTADRAAAVDAWCREHGVACLYFVARSDDAETTRLAERSGYRLTDIRMSFEADRLVGQVAANIVRPAVDPRDLPALVRVARASYRDSRFYFDGRFPLAACDALYETWITNSVRGYADVVLVADVGGEAAGYVTCHLTKHGARGSIGLVAVDAAQQGKGLGKALVDAALAWFADRSVARVTVVTQGRNPAAQRLYERCGFLVREVELYYHKWFED